MNVRLAEEKELERINELRKQVNDLHAILHHINKPENPFMYERDFLDIDEFCVDEAYRRRGAAAAMIDFIRDYAVKKEFHRIELNMWEFNQDALKFYEAAGFATFRRYMEMFV